MNYYLNVDIQTNVIIIPVKCAQRVAKQMLNHSTPKIHFLAFGHSGLDKAQGKSDTDGKISFLCIKLSTIWLQV